MSHLSQWTPKGWGGGEINNPVGEQDEIQKESTRISLFLCKNKK